MHSNVDQVLARCRNALAAMLFCAWCIGCHATATIWSADAPSPDGYWIASAHTEQTSGPGNAWIETIVTLKRAHSSESPREILAFDNNTVWPKGITNVEMRWLTPSHFEVGYKGGSTIDLQVVKLAGLEISVRDLSKPSPTVAR